MVPISWLCDVCFCISSPATQGGYVYFRKELKIRKCMTFSTHFKKKQLWWHIWFQGNSCSSGKVIISFPFMCEYLISSEIPKRKNLMEVMYWTSDIVFVSCYVLTLLYDTWWMQQTELLHSKSAENSSSLYF